VIARIIRWIWRAWPIPASLLLALVHIAIFRVWPENATAINSTTALVLQILGGLLVLYSINSNIGVMRRGSLLAQFRAYLSDFPMRKKSYVLDIHDSVHSVSAGRARLRLTRTPKSLDEAVEYFQGQLDELRKEHAEDVNELRTMVLKRVTELESKVASAAKGIKEVEVKVDATVIGDVRIQIFGVIMLVYGAICAYAA
jgi:hypothetical protein